MSLGDLSIYQAGNSRYGSQLRQPVCLGDKRADLLCGGGLGETIVDFFEQVQRDSWKMDLLASVTRSFMLVVAQAFDQTSLRYKITPGGVTAILSNLGLGINS